jgi:hypothetical protein
LAGLISLRICWIEHRVEVVVAEMLHGERNWTVLAEVGVVDAGLFWPGEALQFGRDVSAVGLEDAWLHDLGAAFQGWDGFKVLAPGDGDPQGYGFARGWRGGQRDQRKPYSGWVLWRNLVLGDGATADSVGNDREKGNGENGSRFPAGMTERKAGAKASAKTKARAATCWDLGAGIGG